MLCSAQRQQDWRRSLQITHIPAFRLSEVYTLSLYNISVVKLVPVSFVSPLRYFTIVIATDPEHQERFEHWLCEVNSSDGISLLTALAQMATPTLRSDPAFVTTVTLLIYQVR